MSGTLRRAYSPFLDHGLLSVFLDLSPLHQYVISVCLLFVYVAKLKKEVKNLTQEVFRFITVLESIWTSSSNWSHLCMDILRYAYTLHSLIHTYLSGCIFNILNVERMGGKKIISNPWERPRVEMKADYFIAFHSIKSTELNDLRIQSRCSDTPSSSGSFYIFSALFKY